MPKEEEAEMVIDESVEDESNQEEETPEEEKSEIDILRDRAIELGIDFKGNWGVKRLTAEIEKMEQV